MDERGYRIKYIITPKSQLQIEGCRAGVPSPAPPHRIVTNQPLHWFENAVNARILQNS